MSKRATLQWPFFDILYIKGVYRESYIQYPTVYLGMKNRLYIKLAYDQMKKEEGRRKEAINLKGLDLDLSSISNYLPSKFSTKAVVGALVSSVIIKYILKGVGALSGLNVRPVLPKGKKPVVTYTKNGEPVVHPATVNVHFHKVFDLKIWASGIAYLLGVDPRYIMKFLLSNKKSITYFLQRWLGSKDPGKRFTGVDMLSQLQDSGLSDMGIELEPEYFQLFDEDDEWGGQSKYVPNMPSSGMELGPYLGPQKAVEGILNESVGVYGDLGRRSQGKILFDVDLKHLGNVKVYFKGWELHIEYTSTYGIYADGSKKQYPVTSDDSLQFLGNL